MSRGREVERGGYAANERKRVDEFEWVGGSGSGSFGVDVDVDVEVEVEVVVGGEFGVEFNLLVLLR